MHSWKWKSCSGRVKKSSLFWITSINFLTEFCAEFVPCLLSVFASGTSLAKSAAGCCSFVFWHLLRAICLSAEVSLFELLNLFDRYRTYAQYACVWKFLCFASWFLLFIYIYLNVGCHMYLQLSSRIPIWSFGHYSNHMTKNDRRSLSSFFSFSNFIAFFAHLFYLSPGETKYYAICA